MKAILFFIVVVVTAVLLFSCNPAKKIERKDKQALDRVEAKIDLLNHAGQAWSRLNPCYPDTIKKGIIITVIDSTSAKGKIDSLNNIIASILNSYTGTNIDSIKTATTKEVEKRCKPFIFNHYKVDTLPPDRRAIEILQSNLIAAQLVVSNQQGVISDQKNQITELKKEKRKTTWFMGGGLFLSLLIIGFLIYLLFKK